MIYDALEQFYTTLAANLPADLAALVADKGIASPGTVSLEKRQNAETFVALGAILPAVGIFGLRAITQAKSQGSRDSITTAVCDVYHIGADPVLLAKQIELLAEAILRTVDRLNNGATGVFAAAALDDSITIELTEAYLKVEAPNYGRRAVVTFPLYDRDTGL